MEESTFYKLHVEQEVQLFVKRRRWLLLQTRPPYIVIQEQTSPARAVINLTNHLYGLLTHLLHRSSHIHMSIPVSCHVHSFTLMEKADITWLIWPLSQQCTCMSSKFDNPLLVYFSYYISLVMGIDSGDCGLCCTSSKSITDWLLCLSHILACV